jgi:signal transduction histidine kinase
MNEWLRAPRSLLLILFLLTLVSISAVGWLGWKLLEQERLVEAQRAQERLELKADQIATTVRGTLAETGDRLSAWDAAPPRDGKPADGLLLLLTGSTLAAFPPERLLYRPFPSPEPEAAADVFAEGEALEFLQGQPRKAFESYQRLAGSPDLAIRAGAWMRIGRVARKLGQKQDSLAAYAQLANIAGVSVAGAPASLVGRHAWCELSDCKGEAEAIRTGLLHGRWALSRGQFDFYWSEMARLLGREAPLPPQSVELAEAVSREWEERNRDPEVRGQRTIWLDDHAFFLMWRGPVSRRAVLLTTPESILKQSLAEEAVLCAAVDGEGRLLAGRRDGAHRAVVRTAAETQLPWTIYVGGTRVPGDSGMLVRRRLLMLGIAVMVLFMISGTYFIARAIRREMEISRLQSDFVSAVSHEFRSPLTSVRQLSELLALGRVPSEDRRQTYYQTILAETERLQRLVETLLNFGKTEAHSGQYRFEELEAATLIQRVVTELEPQISSSGHSIELHGADSRCRIDADPEALSVALRNLLDNAIKYSPNCPTVWVEWGTEKHRVAIRVRDRGTGIALAERKLIFEKFVRGSAAEAGNVKGTGVGLAMVRRIVTAHGGEILVASEPGQGSTFTMLLPAVGKT